VTNKPEILLIDPMMPSVEAEMEQRFLLHGLYAQQDGPALIREVAPRIRAVVTNAPTGVSDDMLNALRSMDQVVLQSHRATTTVETRVAMGELVIANLDAHFAGKEPPTPVV
jgi:phosphoglycerate dehydrogenase-like enzyme